MFGNKQYMRALSKSINKSINEYLIIDLYLILLHCPDKIQNNLGKEAWMIQIIRDIAV